jgi:hypothetical protein
MATSSRHTWRLMIHGWVSMNLTLERSRTRSGRKQLVICRVLRRLVKGWKAWAMSRVIQALPHCHYGSPTTDADHHTAHRATPKLSKIPTGAIAVLTPPPEIQIRPSSATAPIPCRGTSIGIKEDHLSFTVS